MRRIRIEKWKAFTVNGQERDEDLLAALNVLVGAKQVVPRGIDGFRLFMKIADAFEKADKSGTLELEEKEYAFLKETIEADIPATWGMNKNLSKAINDFINAPEVN